MRETAQPRAGKADCATAFLIVLGGRNASYSIGEVTFVVLRRRAQNMELAETV